MIIIICKCFFYCNKVINIKGFVNRFRVFIFDDKIMGIKNIVFMWINFCWKLVVNSVSESRNNLISIG